MHPYFLKNGHLVHQQEELNGFIEQPPESDVEFIIVIPAYNEPDVCIPLRSLSQQDWKQCEVILVLNHGEDAAEVIKKQSEKSLQEINNFRLNSPWKDRIHTIKAFNLPKKHAGVGLARKTGMDEAAYRLSRLKKNGLIVCLDADSTVSNNYLDTLRKANTKTTTNGYSIRYEHPLDRENSNSIILYELFLRYYNLGLKHIGVPYAYHTVGSSMAARRDAYLKQGGMNKRKAGEDFYFLHKIIRLGDFEEITECCVFPSDRTSDRVPFGTGRSMLNYQNDPNVLSFFHDPKVFNAVRELIQLTLDAYPKTPKLNRLPESIQKWCNQTAFIKNLEKTINNTSDKESYQKQFYARFDAFQILKLVHFMRDHSHPDIDVLSAVNQLIIKEFNTPLQALEALRQEENGSAYFQSIPK